MLEGPSNTPKGISIQKQLTGTTEQAGTYLLSDSIDNPPVSSQAIPVGSQPFTGTFYGMVESGSSPIKGGTTITGCSGAIGSLCPTSSTMTLSSAPTLGLAMYVFDLPGPNNPFGDQHYSVTTSLTGNTYGPITAGISGTTLTVTGGAGSLKAGQQIIGINGGVVTKTTTSALHVGDYQNIPVSSCTGIVQYMNVVGVSGGNQVFPPGENVASCVGTSLSVTPALIGNGNVYYPTPATTTTTSGSPVITVPTLADPAYAFWKGDPVNTASGSFPVGTTVVSAVVESWNTRFTDVTLSSNATSSITDTFTFGGAMFAAPSGTTLTFLNSTSLFGVGDFIMLLGTGTGGNGTYNLQLPSTLSPGSTVYAYDTPNTIYISGGPRSVVQQDFLWTDSLPFGTIAFQILRTSPSAETIITTRTYGASYPVNATVAQSSGSGNMWGCSRQESFEMPLVIRLVI